MVAAKIGHSSRLLDEERVTRLVLQLARELALELHPGTQGADQLGAESSIERDFGLDSLALVELAGRLEQAGVGPIPEDFLASAGTPRELAAALCRSSLESPYGGSSIKPRALEADVSDGAGHALTAASTLIEALELQATEQPHRTYILLVDDEHHPQPLLFGSLREQARALAAGLVERGVRPGEPVALMLPTGHEFFVAFYGALYAQAIPVPLYPPARPSQIESHLRRVAGILSNCEARVLITFERARSVAHLLRSLETRLTTVATIEELSRPGAQLRPPSVSAQDIAFLQYTSGSTGQPKGVVLTHANLFANMHAMQRVTGITSADRFVSWLPLYHDMGLIGACLGALLVGYPLVLMSPFVFLSRPVRWLWTIHQHKGTITAAPNFAYEICLNKVKDHELHGLDLSSLRMAFNGAEAVSPQTIERFSQRFAAYGLKPQTIMPVYGLAEGALGLTFPPVGRTPRIDSIDRETFLRTGNARPVLANASTPLRIVSCGSPLPRHPLRITDDNGATLPERMQGHIEFQGPSATRGYYRNSKATADLMRGDWLDTGDLGYLAEGELYVSGRAKDVIIRGGHNIHPQELEQAVAQLQGVRKGGVVVFPATDRASGTERIVVVAETLESDASRRNDMIARIHHLSVDLLGMPVDEIVLAPPQTVLKTSSGKIRRAACREAHERGELGKTTRSAGLQIARLRYHAWRAQTSHAIHRCGQLAWGCRALAVAGLMVPMGWCVIVLTPGVCRRRQLATKLLSHSLRWCGLRLRISGSERSTKGPRVFVVNHASYLDSIVLMATLPGDATFVAKKELIKVPAISLLLRRLGCVFVERHHVREAASGARELQARLAAGESLAMFAEGTFRRDPGLLPFHMGAFSTAARASVPVVPVAVRGTRTLLPDGAVLPRRTDIDIVFCDPLVPGDKSWRAAVELRKRTREQILQHIHEPDLE
jgi:1-acyl-sn-glycerol-3-phosphate acyltransferase